MTEDSSQALRRLEAEVHEFLKAGDHLSALDIYDDLEAKGWIRSEHLVGMGHCLLALRRKQDARETWLRAYSMDTTNQTAIDVLDEFFPGWKRATPPPPRSLAPAPQAEPQPAAAPPPAPPSRQTQAEPVAQPARVAAPAYRTDSNSDEAPVNWEYVMLDLEEGRRQLLKREAQEAAEREKMPELTLNLAAPGTMPKK